MNNLLKAVELAKIIMGERHPLHEQSVDSVTCEFCSKALDKNKGELDHGCLDCAGHVYLQVDGSYFCEHCRHSIKKKESK